MYSPLHSTTQPVADAHQVAPNYTELQNIFEMIANEEFKVISKYKLLDIEILAVRSWIDRGSKTMPVYLSFHESSSIAEVSIGVTSMVGNPFIDISRSHTALIGELEISNNGNDSKLTLNSAATRLIEESKDIRGFHTGFTEGEILYRLKELRDNVTATLSNLQDGTKIFGGAKFFGVSDYILEAALEAEGLQDDPRFDSYKSTGVINIDALGQLSHRQRYDQSCDEFLAIQLIFKQKFGDPDFYTNYFINYLNIPEARRGQLNEFLITNTPISKTEDLTSELIASRGISQYYLYVLDEDKNILASATVWRHIPGNDSRLANIYNNAVQNGADTKGGIVLFEIDHINSNAPKGTTEKLKDLITIVYGQTNCETLVEVGLTPNPVSISSTSFSLKVTESQLAARRMLRMAAGQAFLARSRADEIQDENTLTDSEKDRQYQQVGRDLNGWFRLACDSLMPYTSSASSNTRQDEVTNEWKRWVESSLLSSALSCGESYSFNSQFLGSQWFSKSAGNGNNWDNFEKRVVRRITESIGISSEESTAYVAEYQLSTLTISIRESLAKMLQKWRIDDSKKNRQMGFEWNISEEELKGYLQKDSSIFQILIIDDKPVGVMITFTDIGLTERPEQKMPSANGSIACMAWCDEHQIPYEQINYCYIVAIDKDLRDKIKAGKIPAYPMLIDAMEETAAWLGVRYVLGGVRINGEKHLGNLAMAAHITNGWTPEPYTFKSRIGSDLRLVSRKVPDRESLIPQTFSYSAFVWPNASRLNIILGDPAILAEEDRLAVNAVRSGDSAKQFADIWLEENCLSSFWITSSDHGTLSGGQHGIGIWKNNSQFYFYQVVPDKDLWMNRDTNKVSDFKSCLEDLAIKLRHHPTDYKRFLG